MMNGGNPRTGDKEASSSTNDAAIIENAFPVAMLFMFAGSIAVVGYEAWLLGDCLKDSERFFSFKLKDL